MAAAAKDTQASARSPGVYCESKTTVGEMSKRTDLFSVLFVLVIGGLFLLLALLVRI
jgi:hypothetical protein